VKRCVSAPISFVIAPFCGREKGYGAHLTCIVPGILIVSYVLTLSLIVSEIAALLIGGSPVVTPVVESIIGPICHHIPARTLVFPGIGLLPVCARCTGFYLGWILAGPVGLLLHKISSGNAARLRVGIIFVLAATIVGVVGALVEAMELLSLSNAMRLFFGLPLGFGPWSLALCGVCVLKSRGGK